MKDELKIGQSSRPRFEFRTFGRDFSDVASLMSHLSVPVPENLRKRTSKEVYIVSKTDNVINTKIRDGKMDIKNLIRELDGLEQWNPLLKAEFPIEREFLAGEISPLLRLGKPTLKNDKLTLNEFLALIKDNPGLQSVNVEKERYGYMVDNTICEYARVSINGAMLDTVSVESTEIEDVKKTAKNLGLKGIENINYLQAIKRVIGMDDKKPVN
jgi:hypothetical protein